MSIQIIEHEFSNGLRLIHQRRHESQLTAISVFVRVGSNYEQPGIRGISHFIEHMMFKGTKKYPTAKQLSLVFDEIGAYVNAYTDKNVTCYTVKCDSTYFEKCFKALAEMITDSVFNRQEFEREKQVVVEEINRAKDNTASYLSDKIYELLFRGSSLQFTTGGDPKELLALPHDQFLEYYDSFYHPENIVVSVCSNIDIEKIKSVISHTDLGSQAFSHHPPEAPMYNVVESMMTQSTIRVHHLLRELQQTHVAIAFRTLDMYQEDRYVLDVLQFILSGNMSSRLFINLREKHGLTYNVDVDNSQYEFSGCFVIQTSVDRTKLLTNNGKSPGAIPIIIETLNSILKGQITEDELKKTVGFLKGTITLDNEDSLAISDYNGRSVVFEYSKFISIYDLPKIYARISVKDLIRVARRFFKKERMSVFLIGKVAEAEMKNITEVCSKLIG